MKPVTVFEPRDSIMPPNQFGAKTYGEWCKAEVKRFGAGGIYTEAWAVVDLNAPMNAPEDERVILCSKDTPGASVWCRVDRV